MKTTWDEQEREKKHDRIYGFLTKILSESPGYDESILKGVRDYLLPVLSEFGFEDVRDHISVGAFEFYDAARDYKDELLYAMQEKKRRFDPSWVHNLMSKRLVDMTGYEYRTFLRILDNEKDQTGDGSHSSE